MPLVNLSGVTDALEDVRVKRETGLPSVALNPLRPPPLRRRSYGRTPSFALNPRDGFRAKDGGAEGIRTPDPHNAIVVLYQLSYDPNQNGCNLVSGPGLSKHFPGELPHEAQDKMVTIRKVLRAPKLRGFLGLGETDENSPRFSTLGGQFRIA